MKKARSKLENSRQTGRHQVDEQRTNILDTAEALFLKNGLENTKMVDIAAQAGITKMSLYRYFPNRDFIAVEIQGRMMNKIVSCVHLEGLEPSLVYAKRLTQAMIRNFTVLRDAYRYMGMFDKVYLDDPHDPALPQWTKNYLLSDAWNGTDLNKMMSEFPQGSRFIMVLSTVIWFLEKLALRGELTWSDQSVPLEEHLALFEEMVMGYINQFID